MSEQMNILVLTGGESPEREVALRSGRAVALALLEKGHSVALLDTLRRAESGRFFNDRDSLIRAFEASLAENETAPPVHPSVIAVSREADRVFLALHGGVGENGSLQAMLDSVSARYCGSGAIACGIAMDKELTKRAYGQASILTPPYTVYRRGQADHAVPPAYPCVVKPCGGGSSIGVSFVFSPLGLDGAIKKALKVSDTVMLEKMIFGRELSVSVLKNEPLAVTEVIPRGAFYDYQSKYEKGGARELTPAPLPDDIYRRALRIGKNAHFSLGMNNFSRTDLILEEGTSLLYALETNALPGMTETSILPQAAASRGIGYADLCELMLL